MSPLTSLPLAHAQGYAVEPALGALAAHAVPGLESWEPATRRHTRLVSAPGGPATVSVHFGAETVAAQGFLRRPEDLGPVTSVVRRWLGLDTDTAAAERALRGDPLLGPLLGKRPGLRVLGAVSGFETAVLTVLGQQVSLAAARTFGARLVARWGEPSGTAGLHGFPAAEKLAQVSMDELRSVVGLTRARARSVLALATACADGLALEPDRDIQTTRTALLALPGIGPWTVEYLALRVLRDPDALPATDLVLRRALGGLPPREVVATAAPWRPWRAYAVTHLWTEAAYATTS